MVAAALVYLLQTLLNGCLKGSVEIASLILENVVTVFSADDIYAELVKLVPLSGLHLTTIIFYIAAIVIVLMTLVDITRCMIASVTGQQAENPVTILARIFVTAFLLLIFYGNFTSITNTNTGLTSTILKTFMLPLKNSMDTITDLQDKASSGIFEITLSTGNLTNSVGLIIISGGILGGIITGALAILERLITILMYIFVGPICIAFYTSKTTAQAVIEWLKSLMVQLIVLDFSLLVWEMGLKQLQSFFTAINGVDWWDGSKAAEGIAIGAIAIVLFSIAGKSEEIFQSIGIRLPSGLDSARMVGSGFRTAVGTLHTAQTALSGTDKAFKSFSDHLKPSIANGMQKAADATGFAPFQKMARRMQDSVDIANAEKRIGAKSIGDGTTYKLGKTASSQTANNLARNAGATLDQKKQFGGVNDQAHFISTAGALEDVVNSKTNGAISLPKDVSASEAVNSLSQIADYSNNRMTDTEKDAKASILGDMYSSNESGFIAMAKTADGTETQVFCGKLQDGTYGITNGGSDMSNITQLKNSDGEWMNVQTSDVSQMGNNTHDGAGSTRPFDAGENGELTKGISTTQVMRVEIDPSKFMQQKNETPKVIIPDNKKTENLMDAMSSNKKINDRRK